MATFSQELFDDICERLAHGESLREICRDEKMPSTTSVFRWLSDSATLSEQYARAREVQAHHEADEIKEIADAATPENVQVARLRVDARKWHAGKMHPKVYGDKIAVGGDSGMDPIKTEEVGHGAAKVAAFLDAINSRTPGGAE